MAQNWADGTTDTAALALAVCLIETCEYCAGERPVDEFLEMLKLDVVSVKAGVAANGADGWTGFGRIDGEAN